jgi:hypothetical protein
MTLRNDRCNRRLAAALWGTSLLLLYGLAPGSALGLDLTTAFEIDGNAISQVNPDWNTVFESTTASPARTFLVQGDSPTRYTQGSKDLLDMDQNAFDGHSVPAKGDILNAFAVKYSNGGSLLYVGADRSAENGTAFLGFHFFKNDIFACTADIAPTVPCTEGKFFMHDPVTGAVVPAKRTTDDIFILFNLSQGGSSVSIVVYRWDPSATADPNFDHNYVKVSIDPQQANQLALAMTNHILSTANKGCDTNLECAPWCYLSKFGCACPSACSTPGPRSIVENPPGSGIFRFNGSCSADTVSCFPARTFFEGGVNLGLLGLRGCFQSFMAETRSSDAITAELKDFVLGSFVTAPKCTVTPSSAEVCEGGSGSFCVSPYNANAPYDVTIKDADGNVVGHCADVAENGTCCVTVSEPGTYTSTITDNTNCAATNCPFTLTANAKPTCEVSPAEVCLGGELCVVGHGGAGGFTYAWTGPGGFTASTRCITPTAVGTYTATVTDSKGCTSDGCSGTVNSNPVCTVTDICQYDADGKANELCAKVSGGTAPYDVVWKNSSGTKVAGSTGLGEDGTSCFTPSATGTYTAYVTDAKKCTTQCSGTVNPNPSCDDLTFAHTPADTKVTGTFSSLPASLDSCDASISGTGWSLVGTPDCTVTGPNTFEVVYAITQPAVGTAQLTVTVTDENGCSVTCSTPVTRTVECVAPESQTQCQGATADQFCATVVTGVSPFGYSWTGPGGFTSTEECITPSTDTVGTFEYCVTIEDREGFESTPCCTTLVVNPNPTCSISPASASVCNGDSQTFCATISGGTAPYAVTITGPGGPVNPDSSCSAVAEGGQCCWTTSVAGVYTVSITDDNGCTTQNACSAELVEANCACRVTGGGNDVVSIWPWDGTFASGHMPKGKLPDGVDFYTFGGQAGAPCAISQDPCNGPFGEWTHRQHKGDDGSFTFHAGTASAPEATRIIRIRCSDNGACKAVANATQKQIDFYGFGAFKNIYGNPPVKTIGKADSKSIHYFSVHIEDAGEPGNKDEANSANCPIFGSDEGLPPLLKSPPSPPLPLVSTVNCVCADFYRIAIWKATADPNNPVVPSASEQPVYVVFGYLDGGNLQIHPPIEK